MIFRHAVFVGLVLSFSFAGSGKAAELPEAARIDKIFSQWNHADSPGAAVAVIQHGRIVLEKGFGSANLEYAAPVRPETIFHVASVSKQFTSMAVVLLERAGKLSIDDDVRKYLPELPDYGQRITLRDLMQHTSGIRDQWQTLGIAGWSLQDVITQDQILRMLFRQKELNFPPRTKHLYSNGGYTLLAEVVARVSGKPFAEYCDENIFRPLGMTRTHFHQDLYRIVPGRAYSYAASGSGKYRHAPLNYSNAGATSLFTTAGDLVRWLDNFREPKVGGAAAITRVQEQAVLSTGQKVPYALGIATGKHRGLRTLSHGGGDAGFRSFVAWYPDEEFGIAVVSNLGSFNPADVANQVAEVFLDGKMEPVKAAGKPTERTFINLDEATVRKYAGYYPLPSIDQWLEADARDGKLWVVRPDGSRTEMKAVSETAFYVAELSADVEFSPEAGGGMAVSIRQPGSVVEGKRIALPKAVALSAYTGNYWSEELETQYTIVQRGEKLVALHAHHGEIPLRMAGPDQFAAGAWYMPRIRFGRDSKGSITEFRAGGNRLSGILFRRVERRD